MYVYCDFVRHSLGFRQIKPLTTLLSFVGFTTLTLKTGAWWYRAYLETNTDEVSVVNAHLNGFTC